MMLYLPTLSISHKQENCEHRIVAKFNQVLYISVLLSLQVYS